MVEQEPILGMDYGVPPRKMFLVGVDLVRLWEQAKCTTLGYMQFQESGSGRSVPAIVLMFTDIAKGIEVFKLFQSWDTEPDSGRGVDFIFVQDRTAKTYQMSIGPNWDEARKRLIRPSDNEDYSVMLGGASVGKTMPDTGGGITWVRSEAARGPILVVPAGPDREPLMEHAVRKSDMKFFDKGAVPADLPWVEGASPTEEQKGRAMYAIHEELGEHRAGQMKRFFAVSMARLTQNTSFRKIATELEPKFSQEICLQAACNLLLADRARQNGYTQPDFDKIYDALLATPEDLSSRAPLDRLFTTAELTRQIERDRQYLDDQLQPPPAPGRKSPRSDPP